MERRSEWPRWRDAPSRTVSELNNFLTVIDLHVTRSAVHLKISMLLLLFFFFCNKKGTFHNFLTNRQVNFTTEKVQKNGTAVRHF